MPKSWLIHLYGRGPRKYCENLDFSIRKNVNSRFEYVWISKLDELLTIFKKKGRSHKYLRSYSKHEYLLNQHINCWKIDPIHHAFIR